MIDNRCRTCRHWRPPAPRSRTKAGHCVEDDQLTHAGYTCANFAYSGLTLAAVLGISPAELAWLKAHPDDTTTGLLRNAFAVVVVTNGDNAAVGRVHRLLEDWRAQHETEP